MPWNMNDDEKWTFDGDPERHLLLKAGTRYVELHDCTVHIYHGPDVVADAKFPLGPADDAAPGVVWLTSHTRDDLAGSDDTTVWAALASDLYIPGAT